VGIIGNPRSPLAADVDVFLDASVEREADPDGVVPTASSVVALAIGHALAVVLMRARDFTVDEFGQRHPGGQIGRNLRATAADAMHSGEEVAWVAPSDTLKQVVIAMTARPLGAACVVDEAHVLVGLITDGDLRRILRSHDDIRELCASDVMTPNPIHIAPAARLLDAMRLMEDRPSQISLLPVVNEHTGKCEGIVRLHDICQIWLR
jgi:arabinose-5-phosphate isomerase